MRFLQAQGIDTGSVSHGSLDRYLNGRPLYLNVGRECIRVPTIMRPAPTSPLKLKVAPC